jgi:TonB family protein
LTATAFGTTIGRPPPREENDAMAAAETLCPGCFSEKGTAPVCPGCGFDERRRTSPLALPPRTVLAQQYVVGRVLGRPGGFGITYLGWDLRLETRVAIKEYLPRDMAGRDPDRHSLALHAPDDRDNFRYGLDQFLQEARTLAKFNHPRVVRVRTFFEENDTAYLVMDYVDGISLAEYLERCGGILSEAQALAVMLPVLEGLREIHRRGFLHRDIKPQNIYITSDGAPMLLDFGAARLALGERSRSLSVVLTPGFAPFEQYHRRGEQGPWTDIYACAATLYTLVTGRVPPDALEREKEDSLAPPQTIRSGLSHAFGTALLRAMATDLHRRPADVDAFLALLRGKAPPAAAESLAETVAVTQPVGSAAGVLPASRLLGETVAAQSGRVLGLPRVLAIALAVGLVVMTAAGIVFFRNRPPMNPSGEVKSSAVSPPAEQPTGVVPHPGETGPAPDSPSVTPVTGTAGTRDAGTKPKPGATALPEEGTAAVPLELSENDLRAKALRVVRPVYPPFLARNGIRGLVKVRVTVDETGRVTDVQPVEGQAALVKLAEHALRQCTFSPTLVDGRPVPVTGVLTLAFPPRR